MKKPLKIMQTNNNRLYNIIKKCLHIKKVKSITSSQIIGNHLANDIYELNINDKTYILKKYNYNYDFYLSDRLYKIYEDNNIKCIKPINKKTININGDKFNLFKYLKNSEGIIDDSYISNLININRKVEYKPNLISKCDLYYYYLCNLKKYKLNEEKKVLEIYNSIKFDSIFQDQYLNHGDISISNLLFNNNTPYLIDFDETVVTTELYDFAVIAVKLKTYDDHFDYSGLKEFINKLKLNYSMEDYKKSIKMYLCKILLEKFFLYETGKIDLFDNIQKNDNYLKYINLLEDVENL